MRMLIFMRRGESIMRSEYSETIPAHAVWNWLWAAVEVNVAVFSGMSFALTHRFSYRFKFSATVSDRSHRISAHASAHCSQTFSDMHDERN